MYSNQQKYFFIVRLHSINTSSSYILLGIFGVSADGQMLLTEHLRSNPDSWEEGESIVNRIRLVRQKIQKQFLVVDYGLLTVVNSLFNTAI